MSGKYHPLITSEKAERRPGLRQAISLRYCAHFKALLNHLQARFWPTSTRALTIFEKLPPKLIRHISRYLPLSSRALLILTCRSARETLGTQCWKDLRAKDQYEQYTSFLLLYSKDLPLSPENGYVPCYHCRILHSATIKYICNEPRYPIYQDEIQPAGVIYQDDMLMCKRAEKLGDVRMYLGTNFQFRTFHMAMKAHRRGLDPNIWLKILSSDPHRFTNNTFPVEVQYATVIVESSLLFRRRIIALLPPGKNIKDVLGAEENGVNICPHIHLFPDGEGPDHLPETAPCAMEHRHVSRRCVRRSSVVCCIDCPTEYEHTIEQCWEYGKAVIFTAWMDLGEGETVRDPRWWSHLNKKYTLHDGFDGCGGMDMRSMDGKIVAKSSFESIRDSFERNSENGIDPVLSMKTAKRIFVHGHMTKSYTSGLGH